MIMKEYILNEIAPLNLESRVESAQSLCKGFPFTHFPVVQDEALVGCISESDFQTIEDPTLPIKEYRHLIDNFSASDDDTILDLIKLFADNYCNILPVLDAKKTYLGYYELSDVLDMMSDSPFLHTNGFVLVIQHLKKDYSASQVSQIVESNNATLLGMYISYETSDNIEVTLKLDTEDLNEIIQTFRRYNYSVVTQHKDDAYLQDLKDRSNYLQKYMNM